MEEEFDCKSAIGQLIQNLQKLYKKPQIDHQLSTALEAFQEKVTRQQAYLNNGIFNINFAEAAIFLQSCTELYGKKVDMLWDELLEFHTRLIEYDCEHDKESGKQLDQNVIDKLEERRNRYKRKKKFKLALDQDNKKNFEDFLFEGVQQTEEIVESNEVNNDCLQSWRDIEHKSSLITRIPKAVYKQQLLKYRIKNYRIMRSEDFDIFDPEDGEFNTKYSRVPGWHVIEHIFEYNNKGLLPDKDNVIATLRLSCYLRIKFMKDNNIPFNTPYSEYKDQYLKFKKKFFEEEAKKWQNMPLNTIADLRKQFDYLAKMERENEKKNKIFDPWFGVSSILNNCCDTPNCPDCSDTIILSDDNLNNNLIENNAKKLPQDIADKTRQDSGYFELEDSEMESSACGNIEDGESSMCKLGDDTLSKDMSPKQGETSTCELGSPENNGDCELSKDVSLEHGESSTCELGSTGNNGDCGFSRDASSDHNENEVNTKIDDKTRTILNGEEVETNNNQVQSVPMILPDESGVIVNYTVVENTTEDIDNANDAVEGNPTNGDDNDDILSVMSDHDYCGITDQVTVLKENKNIVNKSDKEEMVPLKLRSNVVPRVGNVKVAKKNRAKNEFMGPPPLKKRKLSQKQIQNLAKSKISPVKEMKFEKFFSLNYQPQMGEGEIQEINYESEEEEKEMNDDNDDTRSVISDHCYSKSSIQTSPNHDKDDVCSHISDHNYFQVDDTTTQDDSGFLDHSEHNLSMETSANSSNPLLRGLEPEDVEEYERLLNQIQEDRRIEGENPEDDLKERERRKRDLLESKARVEEWRETIIPILDNLKENDFDIHEYGGKIMDGMEIGETKLFKNVVDGKSSAEVVRYFMASLQLANTYNIEIRGAKSGEKSNDTYGIKLLNKDRYHEHLKEYHAPSEETFHERIKRMRMLQKKKTIHREIEEPVTKHQRKTSSKRRRIFSTDDDELEPFGISTSTVPYGSTKRSKFDSSSNIPSNVFDNGTDLNMDTVGFSTPSSISGTYRLPSSIEHFESELSAAQYTKPFIQIHSTPMSANITRTVETDLLNQRVLFK
ncbi:uncharacterized protein LOC130449905 isoform X1 [Diorhabda sublineata]|uniref:uncharacterized protein LOC130449905 isoform X1 n=1 Tax=Diorhabda sublineata TaxID=1163346 RepID=UPI0024E116FA|nr:uncharacterized protein LOC130449905 isoform X1 [Diorhabda sublineata]XP_056644085.1 uncharacterized protein LOC130449905 isoform X1 [Diorhabda sublineata]